MYTGVNNEKKAIQSCLNKHLKEKWDLMGAEIGEPEVLCSWRRIILLYNVDKQAPMSTCLRKVLDFRHLPTKICQSLTKELSTRSLSQVYVRIERRGVRSVSAQEI